MIGDLANRFFFLRLKSSLRNGNKSVIEWGVSFFSNHSPSGNLTVPLSNMTIGRPSFPIEHGLHGGLTWSCKRVPEGQSFIS